MEKKEVKVFAKGMCFNKIFWIFMFGCVFGVVCETIYFFLKYNIIESRSGLIYGPLNLVYGFGAVVLLLLLYKIKDTKKVFLLSAIIGGAVEYVCSLFQEKVFGTISWDYIDNFFNFNGRTDLLHMIFWGFLGVFFIKFLWPFLNKSIERIPHLFGNIATIIMIIFMTFNVTISYLAVDRQVKRHQGIKATNNISKFLDNHYTDEYLAKIYTNAKEVEKK